ncbi:MAG: type II toxin-antitoxin system VapC family toxin [Saprospiraceae bacterium]
MDFLWDTNILVHQIRQSDSFKKWNKKYQFFDSQNRSFISIVTVGEIYSLAIQLKWGNKKLANLQNHLNQLVPLQISKRTIIDAYAKIDAYSQGKLPGNPLPKPLTARNMGKNDLWIAATAHVINASLVTTDNDFLHLHTSYFNLITL